MIKDDPQLQPTTEMKHLRKKLMSNPTNAMSGPEMQQLSQRCYVEVAGGGNGLQ